MSMKNTLADLNNHLYAQLERLGDEDLLGEALKEEITRARAITEVSAQLISNGNLALKAKVFAYDYLAEPNERKLPPMLRSAMLEE